MRHREKWRLALDVFDELLEWGLERRVSLADGGYGDTTAIRLGLRWPHHHLTCVTVAHAFLTCCRPRAGPDAARPQLAAA